MGGLGFDFNGAGMIDASQTEAKRARKEGRAVAVVDVGYKRMRALPQNYASERHRAKRDTFARVRLKMDD